MRPFRFNCLLWREGQEPGQGSGSEVSEVMVKHGEER